MTHNIVAQFSCSLDEHGNFKEYRVVAGSVFNEEYSETLDSATIILSQITKEDRLSYIKPYDFVRVFDKSSIYDPATDTYAFDKIYLVDNFNEKENNIKEHLFGYTINLMSETKLLEKIQCPNLVVTHDVNNGVINKKTIYQKIKEYMELFVPKMKFCDDGETWHYEPLIYLDTDTNSDFYQKFNVPCADLPLNLATLRQTLTILMQQVGCIPVVKNRTLTYLDFQQEAQEFGGGTDYSLNNTVNYITRSLSSDSFVNSLVNISDQVLDSGNEVICETLGFRNSNNVLLKQRENLVLETSFPIYKVNKCILHAPGRLSGYLSSSGGCAFIGSTISGYHWPIIYYKEVSVGGGNASIKFCISPVPDDVDVTVKIDKIYFLSRDSVTSVYSIVAEREFANSSFTLNYSNTTAEFIDYNAVPSGSIGVRSKIFNFSDLPNTAVGLMFSGTFINNNDSSNTRNFTFVRFDNADTRVTYHGTIRSDSYWFSNTDWTTESNYINCFIARYDLTNIVAFQNWDISKLVVENSVRQLLDRDFQQMGIDMPSNNPSTWTVDNLSKYVYGTVGYSIGSKQISGFSEVYISGDSSPLGWVSKNFSYIENIVKVLEMGSTYPRSNALFEYFEGLSDMYINYAYNSFNPDELSLYEQNELVNYAFQYYNAGTGSFDATGASFFTSFFVDLYYQPLNSFNLAYVKSQEDIDYSLEQYDGNASGLTDFDRLSIHEQEQVDRVGNETLSISQRTVNYSDIQTFENGPLVFKDDTNRSGGIDSGDNGVDYIIFKRSFSIGNNCYNASYVGSKDAILKNYFTSIRTKYRAYQYVDYNASVLRKERDTFYIRVASDFYNGDDRIYGGEGANNDINFVKYFMYDISGPYLTESDIPKRVSYELETDLAKVSNGLQDYVTETQTIKNSVSSYATKNMLGITYEYMDNVGAGPYIKDIVDDQNLGGIPQSWQIWENEYNDRHKVAFTNFIDFYSQLTSATTTTDDVETQIKNIERSPIVDDSYPYNIVFYICDDNTQTVADLKRTFYKDYAERINHTVQFIYYTPNNDIIFGEDFIAGTPMLQRYEKPFNCIYAGSEFYFDSEPHSLHTGDVLISLGNGENASFSSGYVELSAGTKPIKLGVNFHGHQTLTMAYYDSDTGLVSDIATFKNPDTTISNVFVNYFFMINDTKTDYVMAEKNGILYRRYKAQTFTHLFEPGIPSKYISLNYIESNGTQYIDIGLVPSANCGYEITWADMSANGSNYVMGSRAGSGTIYNAVSGSISSNSITIPLTNVALPNNYRQIGRYFICKANFTSETNGTAEVFCVNTTETFSGTQSNSSSGATANMCIFALNPSNIHKGMRLFSAKIYDNNTLVRDLVPVKRRSDNVVGLYDKINGVFYTNAGSGSFIAGSVKDIYNGTCPREVIKLYDEED